MSRMLFALAALIAFVTGRYTAPEAAPAKPVVTVKTQVERVTAHCPAWADATNESEREDEPDDDDPDAVEAEDTDAVRMLAAEGKRIAELEARLGPDGALRGVIKDTRTGQPLAGVTIVASNGVEAYTAITDENGSYEIVLRTGRYGVSMYYLDTTVEHSDVMVASHKVTPLYGKIEQLVTPYIPTGRTFEGVIGGETHEYESFDNTGVTITDDYVNVIEVPAEGFTDDSGVSFNGSEAAQDAYYD
jgi:hypothetical protein